MQADGSNASDEGANKAIEDEQDAMADEGQAHRGHHGTERRAEAPQHDGESLVHEDMDKAGHGRDVDHASGDEAVESSTPEDGHPQRAHAGHGMHGRDKGHEGATATAAVSEHLRAPSARDMAEMPGEHAGHDMAGGHEGHGAYVDHTGHEQMFRRRFWVSLVLSIPVLLYSPMIQEWLGFTMPAFPGSQFIVPVLSVVVFLYGGLPFLQMAVPELRNRQPGMMTLISLAITVAFVYSLASQFLLKGDTFFWELVTLIDIMLLGHWLEMRSVRQASGALDALAKLMPDTAERERPDGSTEEVPVSQLRAGDLVLVRPGASVPADGEVERGESDVNEAMITGESRPVKKEPGAKVIAGTINGDGSLRVRVTATGEQTALAGIMRLVREAQTSKSRTQVLADKAAGWLFYVALGVAAAHRHRLDHRHRLQRRGGRARRDRAGHRLPARAGPGDPAGRRHHDGQGRQQRHPRARPPGAGTRPPDRHDHLRQDRAR